MNICMLVVRSCHAQGETERVSIDRIAGGQEVFHHLIVLDFSAHRKHTQDLSGCLFSHQFVKGLAPT